MASLAALRSGGPGRRQPFGGHGRRRPFRLSAERGSATAEFVLVGSMLTLLFLAALQLAIDLHVRNVLAACAADGARYAANADVASPEAAAQRTTDLVRHSLGGAAGLSRVVPAVEPVDGAQVVVVRVSARLPTVFGLLPAIPVRVEGRAMLEGAPMPEGAPLSEGASLSEGPPTRPAP